ncbi:MAG: hypothetical protein IJW71_00710 [Clostridia bacterium]|nr:hypothetical protein [Clostridia bacterium]
MNYEVILDEVEEAEQPVVAEEKPKRRRPAVARRYDIETAFYADKDNEEPTFKYHMKGSYKIDLFRLFALLTAFAALFSLLSLLQGGKKKKKK